MMRSSVLRKVDVIPDEPDDWSDLVDAAQVPYVGYCDDPLSLIDSLTTSGERSCVNWRITPDIAETILAARNTNNRKKKEKAVRSYAGTMKAGLWSLTGETLIFGRDGALLDGQNRLYGCVAANTPFDAIVVLGIDPSVFSDLDQGSKRTASDVFKLKGEKHYAVLAAATMCVYSHHARPDRIGQSLNVAPKVLHEFLESEHPGLRSSAVFVNDFVGRIKNTGVRPSLIVALHYLFARRSVDHADRFIYSVCTGNQLPSRAMSNPVSRARAIITDNATQKARGRGLETNQIAARLIKCWNVYRVGGRMSAAPRWVTTGQKPEEFPTIR